METCAKRIRRRWGRIRYLDGYFLGLSKDTDGQRVGPIPTTPAANISVVRQTRPELQNPLIVHTAAYRLFSP